MNNIVILTVLIVGLSGVTAQVLLLRELLVGFCGNELTLGIILGNWLISEALGVFVIGKLIDRVKNRLNVLVTLQIAFSLTLPLMVFLCRIFKDILGIPFAEAIGLYAIFYVSFLVTLPVAFTHGALFSATAKLYSFFAKEPAQAIGKVYAWEIAGTVIGGIALTYLFIPYLNSFQISFIVSLANLIITIPFLKYEPSPKIRYINLAVIILIFILFLGIKPSSLHRFSLDRQWKGQEVLDYRNSLYGNIVVTKKSEQTTFFYNGSPIITLPYPDITFVEEFGHLPLLFHDNPKDILIVSGGAGGLLRETLRHPIERVDYAEMDPLIIKMLQSYPFGLAGGELRDKRLNIINSDGRLFLRKASGHYDVILIGLSRPSDLSTNRLFTKEFFLVAKNSLSPDGILAIWLPGSLTYLSKELRDLNACILNALKNAYGYIRVIPGDYNIILASDSEGILRVSADTVFQKMSRMKIKTNVLTPAYLGYRLDKKWLDWFKASTLDATRKANLDLMPLAVFQMLILWNKQFSVQLANFLEAIKALNITAVFIAIFILTIILLCAFSHRPKFKVAYSIATTGFFGMLMNLLLIFSFQVFYGYLYHMIGLLISIFMTGVAAGSILMTRRIKTIKNHLRGLIGLEAAILLFSYIFPLIITGFPGAGHSYFVFPILFFIPAFLTGLEFPLASKICLSTEEGVGQTAGLLYACDLLGGYLAGILGGIVFLPILGLFNACLVIVMLKFSSLLLLLWKHPQEQPLKCLTKGAI